MGSSGGSSSSGGGTYTMRYASYIEARHKAFLNATVTYRKDAIKANPYDNFTNLNVVNGFFRSGYTLSNYTPIFENFKVHIDNVNLKQLWNDTLNNTVESSSAANLVAAESMQLDEELSVNVLPKFMTSMRDLNAVNSSSFIIGKALLYDTKQKAVNKFSADLKWKLIAVSQDVFKSTLAWNADVVNSHANLLKLYFGLTTEVGKYNYDMKARKSLWPLTIMDYERANLGALQGAMKQSGGESSSGGNILGGVLSGAAAGGMMTGGNPLGMLGGAALGGVASLF